MAVSLGERFGDQLHAMRESLIEERVTLDEQIAQIDGMINSLNGNGRRTQRRRNGRSQAQRTTRRQTSRRKQRQAPVSSEERQKQVLEFMSKHKEPVTTSVLSQELNATPNVIRRTVSELVKSKAIKEAGMAPRGERGGRESKLFALR